MLWIKTSNLLHIIWRLLYVRLLQTALLAIYGSVYLAKFLFLFFLFDLLEEKKELDLGQRPPGCATSRLRPVNQLHFLPYANAIQWISPELSSVIEPTKFSWGLRDRKTTLCSKTPPFIFWIALSKINRFKYFWHVKFWVNLTWNSYRFVHLTCQM